MPTQHRNTPSDANVVGHRIRQFRRRAGLTQKELAALCRPRGLTMTRSTLAKIESKVRWVKACELFILAQVLKVPIERFYPPGFGRLQAGRARADLNFDTAGPIANLLA